MYEFAFTLLSLSFLAFMAIESNRVLTEGTRVRQRTSDDAREPSRLRADGFR